MRVSLAYNGPGCLDAAFCDEFRDLVVELDLSHTGVQDLGDLHDFTRLRRLVLCHNPRLTATMQFPRLLALETLWANWCAIDNAAVFVEHVAAAFPNLRYMSLFGNQACPSIFTGHSLAQYNDYRQFVISKLPSLIHLEDRVITPMEREKARLKYGGTVEKLGLSKVLGKQKKSQSRKAAARKNQVTPDRPEHPYARKKELVIPGKSETPDDEWTTDEEDIDYWAGFTKSENLLINQT